MPIGAQSDEKLGLPGLPMTVNRLYRLVVYNCLLLCLGLVTSVYLLHEEYATLSAGAKRICDLNSVLSCSNVLESEYATLLGVPVAAWGVLWFAIAIWMVYRIFMNDAEVVIASALWHAAGLCSIAYFLWGELQLGVICPACTLVHICVAGSAVCAGMLHWSAVVAPHAAAHPGAQPSLLPVSSVRMRRIVRPWAVRVIVLTLLVLVALRRGTGLLSGDIRPPSGDEAPPLSPSSPQAAEFIECLRKERFRVYGKNGCSFCEKQKKVLGPKYKRLFISCFAREDRTKKVEACERLKINGYPTWVQFADEDLTEEVQRFKGVHSFVELQEKSADRCRVK